jgi:hypothetical protein
MKGNPMTVRMTREVARLTDTPEWWTYPEAVDLDAPQSKAIVAIAYATREALEAKRPVDRRVADAKLDGMCSIACDALGLGVAPFGVKMAVKDAVGKNPHPTDRTSREYPAKRVAWTETIVRTVRETLGMEG